MAASSASNSSSKRSPRRQSRTTRTRWKQQSSGFHSWSPPSQMLHLSFPSRKVTNGMPCPDRRRISELPPAGHQEKAAAAQPAPEPGASRAALRGASLIATPPCSVRAPSRPASPRQSPSASEPALRASPSVGPQSSAESPLNLCRSMRQNRAVLEDTAQSGHKRRSAAPPARRIKASLDQVESEIAYSADIPEFCRSRRDLRNECGGQLRESPSPRTSKNSSTRRG